VLEAHNLRFGYEPDNPILDDCSMTFDGGQMVAVTGPSGRGKSTLLYLLGLMLKPTQGAIRVDGLDAAYLPDRSRARLRAETFGFVFQDAALDPSRSVLDNVIETALYRNAPRQPAIRRAHELLEEFGVAIRADAKPGQVSGGQAQRIALCRALLGNPRILLADEPTGNLDATSAEVVLKAFRAQADSGSAVVLVTHDRTVVERCDRSVEL
jgi:ABC-type lipoprotein export system ATPase subunit